MSLAHVSLYVQSPFLGIFCVLLFGIYQKRCLHRSKQRLWYRLLTFGQAHRHFITKHGEVRKRLGRPNADLAKIRKAAKGLASSRSLWRSASASARSLCSRMRRWQTYSASMLATVDPCQQALN
jgi:hypothetical protein